MYVFYHLTLTVQILPHCPLALTYDQANETFTIVVVFWSRSKKNAASLSYVVII